MGAVNVIRSLQYVTGNCVCFPFKVQQAQTIYVCTYTIKGKINKLVTKWSLLLTILFWGKSSGSSSFHLKFPVSKRHKYHATWITSWNYYMHRFKVGGQSSLPTHICVQVQVQYVCLHDYLHNRPLYFRLCTRTAPTAIWMAAITSPTKTRTPMVIPAACPPVQGSAERRAGRDAPYCVWKSDTVSKIVCLVHVKCTVALPWYAWHLNEHCLRQCKQHKHSMSWCQLYVW